MEDGREVGRGEDVPMFARDGAAATKQHVVGVLGARGREHRVELGSSRGGGNAAEQVDRLAGLKGLDREVEAAGLAVELRTLAQNSLLARSDLLQAVEADAHWPILALAFEPRGDIALLRACATNDASAEPAVRVATGEQKVGASAARRHRILLHPGRGD